MRSIEIFSGTGGLALGLSQAGIEHECLIEWNKHCMDTLHFNREINPSMREWKLIHKDIREVDFRLWKDKIDLVAGGPPCQPFSLGGKHKAHEDVRDMFPEAARAVREIRPKAFLFENVKGLTRPGFRQYLDYILQSLRFPEISIKENEIWQHHSLRLQKQSINGPEDRLEYHLLWKVLNAADYGIPQIRERVIILGIRSDLGILPSLPNPTHSEDSLLYDQLISNEYWKRHCIEAPRKGFEVESQFTSKLSKAGSMRPWLTVRDALQGLPNPINGTGAFYNHVFKQGARSYPGHNGSFIDEPSKTIKAGAHGVPGGENMIRLQDGCVRYFTVRESARIQTFPDDYIFQGSWTESMRQIGNAVPVELGRLVGIHLVSLLNNTKTPHKNVGREISEVSAI